MSFLSRSTQESGFTKKLETPEGESEIRSQDISTFIFIVFYRFFEYLFSYFFSFDGLPGKLVWASYKL